MNDIVPRISTRGYYDLDDGSTLKRNDYFMYTKDAFYEIAHSKEFVIMVHGFRNNKNDAINKTIIARNRLKELGYRYNIVGFSYDSNTWGTHHITSEPRALAVAKKIAIKNGRHLSNFIVNFKSFWSPKIKIRLMGHSLGSQVILSAIEHLFKKPENHYLVESVHLFGASIPCDVPSKYSEMLDHVICKKIVNYYNPTDEVLLAASGKTPLGLNGAVGTPLSKYHQRMVKPENHRFASYSSVLRSFPY